MNEISGNVQGPVVQARTIAGDVHINGAPKPRLEPIALYYPYIHVRDETWLKYAALYWPKLGRLRPDGYPTKDSAVAKELGDWLVDVRPDEGAMLITHPFISVIAHHGPALRSRYGIAHADRWPTTSDHGGNSAGPSPELNARLAYIHFQKVAASFMERIIESGLAVRADGRGGGWLGMHPAIAAVYLCALTEQVAAQEHLHPVTDQALPHAALSGWSIDRVADVLLGTSSPPRQGDPVEKFVVAAFRTVVPANLASVPIDKINELRTRYGRELNAFREYVAAQVEDLGRLTDVRAASVFRAHLEHEVGRKIEDRLADLFDMLRELGLEPTTALATVKARLETVPELPTGSGALATTVVSARRVVRESPVGYLLHLGRELNPRGLAERVAQAMR